MACLPVVSPSIHAHNSANDMRAGIRQSSSGFHAGLPRQRANEAGCSRVFMSRAQAALPMHREGWGPSLLTRCDAQRFFLHVVCIPFQHIYSPCLCRWSCVCPLYHVSAFLYTDPVCMIMFMPFCMWPLIAYGFRIRRAPADAASFHIHNLPLLPRLATSARRRVIARYPRSPCRRSPHR